MAGRRHRLNLGSGRLAQGHAAPVRGLEPTRDVPSRDQGPVGAGLLARIGRFQPRDDAVDDATKAGEHQDAENRDQDLELAHATI